MELRLKKNAAAYITFPMVDKAAPETFKTGETVSDTAYYKDGSGAWTSLSITDTVSEIGSTGLYELDLSSGEMNHDIIIIKFAATNSQDQALIIRTANIDANIEAIDADTGSPALLLDFVTTGYDATGHRTYANVKNWNNITVDVGGTSFLPKVDAQAISDSTTAADNVESNIGNLNATISSRSTFDYTTNQVTVGTNNDKTGYSITTTAEDSIVDKVWDELRSGHTAAGSFGEGVASVQGNVTGSVGSVVGAVGSVTGAVGSVTGNVGGNVVGSVDSVVDPVTVGTNNDKTGYALSTTSEDSIVDKVWDELKAGHTTPDSFGDYLDDEISSRGTSNFDYTVNQVTVGTNNDKTGYALSTTSEDSVVDKVWDELRSSHTAAGSFGEGVSSVQGNVTGSVASVTGAVGSVTGNVGGNVGGSVASVVAGVTVTTNNDKTGYSISGAKTTLDALNDISTLQVNAEVDTALADIGLDHLVSASVSGSDVADDSIIAQMVSKSSTADWDSFDNTADSLEAIRDRGDTSWSVSGESPLATGTAQAGDAGSITLAAGSSAVNNFYDGTRISILSGSGVGQSRILREYNGTTKVAAVAPGWKTNPSSDSVYAIYPGMADIELINGSAAAAAGLRDMAEVGYNSTYHMIQSNLRMIDSDPDAVTNLEADYDGTGYSKNNSSIGSVSGAVGSVTGNVGGNVAGSVGSVTGAVGSVTGNVGGSVASVVGNIGGNVVGSVDSVVDPVTVGTNNDKTGYSISGSKTTLDALNDVSTVQVNAEVDSALADIGLDHLVAVAVTGTDVTDNSIMAKLAAKGAPADWDTFNNITDSLEAISDMGAGTDWSAAEKEQIRDALGVDGTKTTAIGGQLQVIDGIVDNILTDTANIDTNTGGLAGAAMRGTDNALLAASAPTNFGDLAITALTGKVTVGTNDDKTDYALSGTSRAAIADDVWDELRSGHTAAGSFGQGVASVQGSITGNVDGTVASVVGNVGGNVTGSVGSVAGNVAGSVGSVVAAVTVGTNNDKTGYTLSAAGVDDVWNEAQAGHVTPGTFGYYLDSPVSGAGSALTAQEIRDALKLAPTGGAPAAGSVDEHLDDILNDTNETQGKLPTGTISNLTAGQVNAEVVDVLTVDTQPELSLGTPPATESVAAMITRLRMSLVMKGTQTKTPSAEKVFYNSAGNGIWKKSVTDDGTVYTEQKGIAV